MNKQELIEKLKLKHSKLFKRMSKMECESYEWEYISSERFGIEYAIRLAKQLDEPKVEECEIIETERNDYVSDFQCSNCKTSFDLFKWVYAPNTKVNFCPNCGRKIVKEKQDDKN